MMRFFLLFPVFLLCVTPPQFREPSEPFITGDGFRSYADFAFDELDATLNPKEVRAKSTVFVKLEMLGRFFQEIHPFIEHPYILISHNGDDPAPGKFYPFLDDPKLIAWFTQNFEGKPHPKLHPIPIGVGNRPSGCGNPDILKSVIDKNIAKEYLVYCNLTIQNYLPERWQVFQLIGRAPYCYRPIKKRFDRYLADVAASKFVLSPRGVGLDTYRLWETLYLHSFPIVKSSSIDSLYEGLPVLVIKEWTDVTEDSLKQKYEEMSQKTYNIEERLKRARQLYEEHYGKKKKK
ncbi:MAG: hypothetical protein HY069_01545 [Chlamydiia bacterium]|nr:hypothetical protein [Chlamydiia bacterium]